MPKPKPVTKADLESALRYHGGNVQAAARNALKISRQAIYDKLHQWGLDPDDYRTTDYTSRGVSTDTNMTDTVRAVGELISDKVRASEAVTKLGDVVARTAETIERRVRPTPAKIGRLAPPILSMIQSGRLRLQAHTGEETTNDLLLEEYILDGFDAWLDRRLSDGNGDQQ